MNAFRLASCAMRIGIDVGNSRDNGDNENDALRRILEEQQQRRHRWPPAESMIDADPFDAVQFTGLFTLACFFNHRYLLFFVCLFVICFFMNYSCEGANVINVSSTMPGYYLLFILF